MAATARTLETTTTKSQSFRAVLRRSHWPYHLVMVFALISAVDYFIKFSKAILLDQPSSNL